MKRILTYTLLAATVLSSCMKLSELNTKSALTLEFDILELNTKATVAGDNTLNENKIDELDVFFYKNGESDAKIYKHFSLSGENSLNIHLSTADLTKLGYTTGNATTFGLFVIANRPDGVSVTGIESIAALKDKNITATKAFNEIQDNFVMTGEAIASGGSGTNGFTASVNLKRTASKFGLSITATTAYNGEIDNINSTWSPVPSAATVKFFGSTTSGKLGGAPTRNAQVDYETEHSIPAVYYSYPSNPLPENQPYYVIMLPWNNGAVTKNTYYKVICDYEQFSANTFYQLSVDITRVGSSKEPEAVRLSPEALNFSTAPWGKNIVSGNEEFQTQAVIKDARYLVTYSDSYTMENVNSIEIPFTSSHPCTVTVTSARWRDFSTGTPTVRDLSATQYTGNKTVTAVINSEGDGFTLTHVLNNDFVSTSNYDVSPITYTVTLKHTDDSRQTKSFTIVQNPAIILDVIANSNDNNDSNRGYRFINGVQNRYNDDSTNEYERNLGGLQAPNGQTNNMYVIKVSALPEGSRYVIGDPRSLDVNNLTWNTNATTKQAQGKDIVTNTDRYLTNYYPTRDDGSADNVIAPEFMTSSGWSRGSSGTNQYDGIKRRAATYQELGYPAGRWRLLTKAEASIVASLNQAGKIPMLFSATFPYYVAGGYILTPTEGGAVSAINIYDYTTINTSHESSRKGSARLCYDRWYWDQTQYPKCANGTYTYGDMPRQ